MEEYEKKDTEVLDLNNIGNSNSNSQIDQNSIKLNQPNKTKKLILIISISIAVIIILIPFLIFFISSLNVEDSFKEYKREYSKNEIAIAESNTFKKLNNISYPNNDKPYANAISNEENSAYSNFSNLTYHSLVDSSKKDNMSYSIVGLYSIINELTSAVSREELKVKFDNLLGLNEESRISFYTKVMQANSFIQEESTIQLKNGAFFNNKYNYNREYINTLSKLYCEAYQLNFASDTDKIVEWVNQAVKSNGFIDKDFLEINDITEILFFSTLYFKNKWNGVYISKNNIEDDFYLADGNKVKTTYMQHSYLSSEYYDYGSYISIKDYYINKNASITYLVPKKVEDNIFTLTKDKNIFEEKKENIVKNEDNNDILIHLTTPKFVSKVDVVFKECLSNLGFSEIFNHEVDSFKNAFNDPKITNVDKTYIQKLKQRNEVEFNEDGSTIKSITMASMLAGSAAPVQKDSLDVNLNQPFIYIIRDINDTPIFVGHIDNPNSK